MIGIEVDYYDRDTRYSTGYNSMIIGDITFVDFKNKLNAVQNWLNLYDPWIEYSADNTPFSNCRYNFGNFYWNNFVHIMTIEDFEDIRVEMNNFILSIMNSNFIDDTLLNKPIQLCSLVDNSNTPRIILVHIDEVVNNTVRINVNFKEDIGMLNIVKRFMTDYDNNNIHRIIIIDDTDDKLVVKPCRIFYDKNGNIVEDLYRHYELDKVVLDGLNLDYSNFNSVLKYINHINVLLYKYNVQIDYYPSSNELCKNMYVESVYTSKE
jgi:hypothetical protein